jgi:SpoIID/LytB domain protein
MRPDHDWSCSLVWKTSRLAVLAAPVLLAGGLWSASAGAASPPQPASGLLSPPIVAGPAGTITDRRVAADEPASTPAVRITTLGAGNAVGLGQWGAYGYASNYGESYQWIVDHFYGTTYLEPLPTSTDTASIDVDLSQLDDEPTTIVKANRAGAALIVNGVRETGTRVIGHGGKRTTIRATAGDVAVEMPGHDWLAFQGEIQTQTDHLTWNVVPLEDYVAGVVPSEMYASWGASGGEAALEAQAVAARSYALAVTRGGYPICDWAECQQYNEDPGLSVPAYARYTDRATSSTRGMVMCTAKKSPCPIGDVVTAYYSASDGGYTAGGPFPIVQDLGNSVDPYNSYTTSYSIAALESDYPSVGAITGLHVSKRNGYGTWGGRAVDVKISGKRGSVTAGGETVASILGLPSNWFRFDTQP